MNCAECKTRPIYAVKRGLCRVCLGRESAIGQRDKRRAHMEAMLSREWEARRAQQQQERNDFLNAFRGMEKAIKRLSRENPHMDNSRALRDCRERIAALSEGR